MRNILCAASLVLTAAASATLVASDPGSGDWPMWGGTPDRNMVSSMKGLPTQWDIKTKKNVKWVADLGSQSYGNPVDFWLNQPFDRLAGDRLLHADDELAQTVDAVLGK